MSSPWKLGSIAIDCPDPQALATFYTALLDVDPGFMSEGFAAFKLQGLWISLHRVEDYRAPRWPDPSSPQQLHLDLAVGVDLDEAEQRAISLGATRADEQPAPDRWRVMIDPAGHPFCLCPTSAFPD